jgi:putative hydrolase of HD superfamily
LLADQLRLRSVAVDCEKVLRIALLHDWAEVRVGDMPRTATAYFGAESRKEAEMAAFADIVGPLSTQNFYTELHKDYETRDSLEARLVKASDVIDLLVQVLALERAGARGLDEFWMVASEPNFNLEGAAREIVHDLIQSLVEARKAAV